ncbi:hypothetical protein ANANG_G00291510 [Anguilla anguilla]|uniref:Uncharacterized protein n=1 Tax=Anguilla anguilla TaxID=7936 RepID=A0A9D3LL60_ANGAN|nr:hypothetical protein ANANG_G00291510 [Anguilla anguilla]
MEDKKRKKEEKRKKEASQKITEHKNKVPDLTKPTSAPSPATPSSTSPALAPSPRPRHHRYHPQGGNNAKRQAVPNGQPPSGAPAAQRYMPRSAPRFRCQQDHKVLLKRGQPPLSCMLLGAPAGSPLCRRETPPMQSQLEPWIPVLGLRPPSQGWEKVIVDGSDLEEWPSIAVGAGGGDRGGAGGTETGDAQNSSASWMDRQLQQKASGAGNAGNSDSPSPPSSSSSSCSPDECTLSGGVAWGSSSQTGIGGGAAATAAGVAPSKSKASSFPGTADDAIGVSGGTPGANFNPNANPSAWPALVQDETTGAGTGVPVGLPSSLPPPPSLSANPALGHAHLPRTQPIIRTDLAKQRPGRGVGAWAPQHGAGPKKCVEDGDSGTAGAGDAPPSLSSSSWRDPAFSCKTAASRTDGWEHGEAGGDVPGEGGSWGRSGSDRGSSGSEGGKSWGAGNGGSCKTPRASQGEWSGEDLLVGNGAVQEGWRAQRGLAIRLEEAAAARAAAAVGAAWASPLHLLPLPPTTARAWDNQKGVGEGVRGGREAGSGAARARCGGTSSSSGGGAQSRERPRQSAAPPRRPPPALKWPYRTCSAGPTWTHGSCPTPAGARPRSGRMWPGT